MNNEVINSLRDRNYPAGQYCSLYTIFSSTGKKPQSLGNRACFGNVLKYTYGSMHNTYTIYTYTEEVACANNLCIFTPEEIRSYLKYISDIVPFSFEVSDINEPNTNNTRLLGKRHIKIFIDINGPHINHVFVLTFVRYLYEHPYKYVLADVFRMKEIPEFSKLSLFNLYNALAFSIEVPSYGYHFSNDMSHYPATAPVLFLRKENIRERMQFLTDNAEKANNMCVGSICDIFPINDSFKQPLPGSDAYYRSKVDKFSKYGFKFIIAEGSYKRAVPNMAKEFLEEAYWPNRLKIYRNNIKLLIDATDEQIKGDTEEYNKHLTTFKRYD